MLAGMENNVLRASSRQTTPSSPIPAQPPPTWSQPLTRKPVRASYKISGPRDRAKLALALPAEI